jgi:hypothetical protein
VGKWRFNLDRIFLIAYCIDMNYTDENVMVVAQKIVDDMELDDLMSYVYDDLCAIMDKDEELFNSNVDHFEMNESINGGSK